MNLRELPNISAQTILGCILLVGLARPALALQLDEIDRNVATTYFGYNNGERAQGISLMANGDILIAGETNSQFPTTGQSPFALAPGIYRTLLGGPTDGYVAIL